MKCIKCNADAEPNTSYCKWHHPLLNKPYVVGLDPVENILLRRLKTLIESDNPTRGEIHTATCELKMEIRGIIDGWPGTW